MSPRVERVDLRGQCWRVQVERMLLPAGMYGARLYVQAPSKRWRPVGPFVIAEAPHVAARDLLTAVENDQLTGVELSS